MLHRKCFSSAAHAGHDFVGDEKNPALAADFCDAFYITVGRSCGTECRTNDRFENKCGDSRSVIGRKKRFEILGAGKFAIGEGFAERTVTAETGRDVAPVRKKWLIGRSASDVAADSHGAESAAVITLAARNDAELLWGSGFERELARGLDGGVGSFGTSGGRYIAAGAVSGRSDAR